MKIRLGSNRDAPGYLIETSSATYFYESQAGGFASILDRDGNDWIQFRKRPQDRYPASAASMSRGLPNLVYQSADNGSGHPGYDTCVTVQVDAVTLRSFSKSGKWQWSWRFSALDAVMTLERADPDHPYWFLYEGPIAGRFAPHDQYWGHSGKGPINTFPDYFRTGGEIGQWNWAYFGDNKQERIFLVQHLTPDNLPDVMGYLGNTPRGLDSPDGMVVFGFGRYLRASPLMSRENQRFRIAFIQQSIRNTDDHQALTDRLNSAP